MSPEQMQPEVGVDKRADLYALGTIAYLMLGGKTPFSGEMMQLVMQKIMHEPPLLSTLRTDVPGDVERVIMRSLKTKAQDRPNSVSEWIDSLESAASDVSENQRGGPKLIILGPVNAEVYVDDERRASVGSSGRVVLTDIPPGRHILRVSKAGEKDDERVIEIREGANEQVIQAQLRHFAGERSQPSSQGSSTGGSPQSSLLPGIVGCNACGARYAEGVRFCGRCGGASFTMIVPAESPGMHPCPRCRTPRQGDSKFCGKCGYSGEATSQRMVGFATMPQSSLPPQAERLCRRCGSVFPAHIRFCGRCGLTLG